jgi:nucleoside-diphosphate-sugar epimerase
VETQGGVSTPPATVLIAGCGDLGCELGRRLVDDGHRVIGLRRSAQPLPNGMISMQVDVTQAHTLSTLSALNPELLIYSVAADARTDDSYRRHYVDGLRNVLAALQPCASLRHVFFVSSTRVYGQQTDAILDENTAAIATDFGGERLLEAEALLDSLSIGATALRLSGIYGPGRTRMLQLARSPHAWPEHNAWTNRIHRDDAAAFIALLVRRALNDEAVDDCYIVTDSEPAPQYAVLSWLAQQMQIDVADVAIPPVGGGKRLSNRRMLQSGFSLTYAHYRAGYTALIRQLP